MTTGQILETGWLAATPSGDNLMRQYFDNLAGMNAVTVQSLGGRVTRDAQTALSDLGRPTGMTNAAVLLQPVTSDADWTALMAKLDGFFGFNTRSGAGEVFLFSP